MSSAICFNLDQSKILLSGKGLKSPIKAKGKKNKPKKLYNDQFL